MLDQLISHSKPHLLSHPISHLLTPRHVACLGKTLYTVPRKPGNWLVFVNTNVLIFKETDRRKELPEFHGSVLLGATSCGTKYIATLPRREAVRRCGMSRQ
jgi:hypothetical protein